MCGRSVSSDNDLRYYSDIIYGSNQSRYWSVSSVSLPSVQHHQFETNAARDQLRTGVWGGK